MTIAVNTRFWQDGVLEGYGYFAQQVFSNMAMQQPLHNFIWIFDKSIPTNIYIPNNVKAIVVKPVARHALSFLYWYNVAVPLALKKYKPQIIIQPFGYCSLFTKVKQILVIHDLAFIHYPKFIPKHHLYFYKLFTPLFIKKATAIATVSEFSKQDIITQYKTKANKISVIYSAAKPFFIPLSWEDKQQTQDSYANGFQYFLFVGGVHPRKNVMGLLKAFSIFKKWQQSNFKLLIAGRLAWQFNDVVEKLKTYKYKDDVVLLDYVEEKQLARLVASAYAIIYPSFFEGFGVPIIEAMQSKTSIITSNVSSMPEIAGDAALYCNPNEHEDIAKQMITLYKDENLKQQLVAKGVDQANKFTWANTSNLLWSIIEKIG
ncbi:MAG: glycosyltransferase family 4 protein [Chitinophagaceae bacterium]